MQGGKAGMMKFGQAAGGMGKKEFRNEEDAN